MCDHCQKQLLHCHSGEVPLPHQQLHPPPPQQLHPPDPRILEQLLMVVHHQEHDREVGDVVGPVLAQLLGHGDAVVAPDGGEVLHHLAADVGSTRLVSARIVLMEGPANFPPAPSTQNTLLQLS